MSQRDVAVQGGDPHPGSLRARSEGGEDWTTAARDDLTQVQETDTVEVELVRVEVVLVQVQCHGHCSLVSVMMTLVTGDDGLLLQLPVHQDSVTIKWLHIIINSPTQVKFTSLASKLIKPVILQ